MLVDFLEMARRVGERDVGTSTIVLLIFYRAPYFTEQLLPFAVLFGAIGTFLTSASPKTAWTPRAMALATSSADTLPLYESGATTIRKTSPWHGLLLAA